MYNASGIGVYIRECLPFFLDYPHSFQLLGSTRDVSGIAGNRQNTLILDCDIKPFSVREILAFPRNIIKKINHGDIFYTPFFNIPPGISVPVYTTIHDIIFADMPGLDTRAGIAGRMWFYRRAARLSRAVFTVSEFSKSRIQHHFSMLKPVIVTHSAVRSCFLECAGYDGTPKSGTAGQEAAGKRAGSKKAKIEKERSILFVGNIKKHKGLLCLLDAFFAAVQEGLAYKLVIVGSRNNFRSRDNEILKHLDRADRGMVEFSGFVSDESLWELLSRASLLVQPSLYEGFGLPPLEAMMAGTKALISDIPVFREIYDGYPVCFFRAGDSGDLKIKLISLLYKKEPEHIVLSQELIEKYNFRKTASIIMGNLIPG
jgi:glycosyltransferase involved in cell wall biosynthesis